MMRAWWSLGVLIVAYAVSFIDRQILSLLVEPIQADLKVGDTAIGLLQGLAFATFYSVLGIPAALLAERFGRVRIIMVGVVVWSALTMACGLARTFSTLALARAGVGIGEAALSPAAQSLIADYFPRERVGLAQSLYAIAIPIGGGLALALGGALAEAVGESGSVALPLVGAVKGWQAAFLIVGAASFLLLPLLATLQEPARRHFTPASDAAESLTHFLRRRRKVIVLYFAGMSMLTMMAYANVAWFPSYFIRVHDMARGEVGLIYGAILGVCGSAGLIAGGLFSDALVRRGAATGHQIVAAGAAAVFILPGVAAGLVPDRDTALACVAWLVFFGAIPTGCAAAMTQLLTPPHLRGQVVAIFLLCLNLVGFGLGPLLVGAMTDHVFGAPDGVGRSLATMIGIAGSAGALLLALSSAPYRRALEEN
jgi:MFS family permease